MKTTTTPGAAGFTLIELMVTIVIATILIAIAVPTYQIQMRKSRRTEAKTAILDFASREERLFATQNAYSTDPVALGYTAAGGSWPVSTGTYYQINTTTIAAPTATTPATFSVTVVPIATGPQANDGICTSFTVTNTGLQSATGSNPSACWP